MATFFFIGAKVGKKLFKGKFLGRVYEEEI
jgi:hypothetical protein